MARDAARIVGGTETSGRTRMMQWLFNVDHRAEIDDRLGEGARLGKWDAWALDDACGRGRAGLAVFWT